MGYQEGTLQQVAVFNTTPNGIEGGLWQSGAAPAVDENGNIYLMAGNGTTSISTGGVDYSEALINFNFTGSALAISDYFLPTNFQSLNNSDLDLGSGAPMLIPTQPTAPTQLLVAAGKQGVVYLVDRNRYSESSALWEIRYCKLFRQVQSPRLTACRHIGRTTSTSAESAIS